MKKVACAIAIFVLGSACLPSQSLNLKIGYFQPAMRSDLWDINMENLIFERSDMLSSVLAIESEYFFTRLLALSLEVGNYGREIDSQYRYYTDSEGQPLIQNFLLRITPITLSVKAYPLGHRAVVCPYILLGGGMTAWTYEQWGDFLNFEDWTVSSGTASSEKFTPCWTLGGGLVFRLKRQIGVALEGKYLFLKGQLSEFFEGFEPLDMSGFFATLGINFYFR